MITVRRPNGRGSVSVQRRCAKNVSEIIANSQLYQSKRFIESAIGHPQDPCIVLTLFSRLSNKLVTESAVVSMT